MNNTIMVTCLNEQSYLDGRYIIILKDLPNWKDIMKNIIGDKTIKQTLTVIR